MKQSRFTCASVCIVAFTFSDEQLSVGGVAICSIKRIFKEILASVCKFCGTVSSLSLRAVMHAISMQGLPVEIPARIWNCQIFLFEFKGAFYSIVGSVDRL
jgi:putative component of membrane protein insertase Oxa1/YidC/SpoIIIJ protein YidD